MPFIVLYRRPDEVILSHARKRGVHAVSGMLEPEIFGLDAAIVNTADLDRYLESVLRAYFEKMLAMADDPQVLFLNYSEGIERMMERIGRFTATPFSEDEWVRIRQRGLYHAKYPHQVFREETGQPGACSDGLMKLYEAAETFRIGRAAGKE